MQNESVLLNRDFNIQPAPVAWSGLNRKLPVKNLHTSFYVFEPFSTDSCIEANAIISNRHKNITVTFLNGYIYPRCICI